MEHAEDAGVYRLRDDLAIIQTVDFFTPIVDDPYTFGRIAVTNALSDIYAMGGRPLTALNIVCFPIRKMDVGILRDILRGGLDQMREAGVLLIGGHSVEDDEPKYGLSVTGVIHPDKVLFNRGARPGDRLILTKALGTGIVSTAVKGVVADPALVERAVVCMTTLNREAAELMAERSDIHACTDVTGFGLLGHLYEMCLASHCAASLNLAAIPLLPGAETLSASKIRSSLYTQNQAALQSMAWPHTLAQDPRFALLFDPQTSGGLLAGIPAEIFAQVGDDFHQQFTAIGQVSAPDKAVAQIGFA